LFELQSNDYIKLVLRKHVFVTLFACVSLLDPPYNFLERASMERELAECSYLFVVFVSESLLICQLFKHINCNGREKIVVVARALKCS